MLPSSLWRFSGVVKRKRGLLPAFFSSRARWRQRVRRRASGKGRLNAFTLPDVGHSPSPQRSLARRHFARGLEPFVSSRPRPLDAQGFDYSQTAQVHARKLRLSPLRSARIAQPTSPLTRHQRLSLPRYTSLRQTSHTNAPYRVQEIEITAFL